MGICELTACQARRCLCSKQVHQATVSLIKKGIERIVEEHQLAATQTYLDFDVSNLDQKEISKELKRHAWVGDMYFCQGSLRVFPVKPEWPKK